MLRLHFDHTVEADGTPKADQKDTPTEIAWANLCEAAKAHNLHYISSAAIGWLRANPDREVVDLENQFRLHNIDVTLLAREAPPKSPDEKPLTLRKLRKKHDVPKYELAYCCRGRDEATEEIKKTWASYEENITHLGEVGVCCIVMEGEEAPDPMLDMSNEQGLEALQKGDMLNAAAWNFVKYRMDQVPKEELVVALKQDLATVKRNTGKEAECRAIGTAKDGTPVAGFFIDQDIVTNLGVQLGVSNDLTPRMEVVLVDNQSTWTGFSAPK